MPLIKYNDLIDEEHQLQQVRARLEEDLLRGNLEEVTRSIIENELYNINDQLITIRSMREIRGPIPPIPLPPLLMLPNESVSSGPGSPQYAPGSPPYAPGSPPYAPGSPPYAPDSFDYGPGSPPYTPGSPISTVPNSPGSPESLRLSHLNMSRESQDEIIDVDPTPPGSRNTTPPGRDRHSGNPVGGTKKKKGKKRKTMKKKKTMKKRKSAKKGKKTKKR